MNAAESALVAYFRSDPSAAARMANRHLPDDTGVCAGCRGQRRWPRWPCRLRLLAHEALTTLPVAPSTPGETNQ